MRARTRRAGGARRALRSAGNDPPAAPGGAASLALALDLVAGCLGTGGTPSDAVALAGAAVGGVPGRQLLAVAARLRAGSPAGAAWAALVDRGSPAVVARLPAAATRSERTGAPLQPWLTEAAAELRRARSAAAERAGRRAGVLVVLPLGLCFLPAYLVLGVLPSVIGLVAHLR